MTTLFHYFGLYLGTAYNVVIDLHISTTISIRNTRKIIKTFWAEDWKQSYANKERARIELWIYQ